MNNSHATSLSTFEKGKLARITGKFKTPQERATALGLPVNTFLRFKDLGRANTSTIAIIRAKIEASKVA